MPAFTKASGGQRRTPPLAFRSQAMRPAPPALRPPSEGRARRGQNRMERAMYVLTIRIAVWTGDARDTRPKADISYSTLPAGI
jgi:hypothetical protein